MQSVHTYTSCSSGIVLQLAYNNNRSYGGGVISEGRGGEAVIMLSGRGIMISSISPGAI